MRNIIVAITVIVLAFSMQSCGDKKYVVTVISKHASQDIADDVAKVAAGWPLYDVITASGDTQPARISPEVLAENALPFKAEMKKADGARYGYVNRSIGHNTEPGSGSHAFLAAPKEKPLTNPSTVEIPCKLSGPISNPNNVAVIFNQRVVRARLDTVAIAEYVTSYAQIQQGLKNHQEVKCLMRPEDNHFVIVWAHVEELPDGPDTVAQSPKPVFISKTTANKKVHGSLSQPKQD